MTDGDAREGCPWMNYAEKDGAGEPPEKQTLRNGCSGTGKSFPGGAGATNMWGYGWRSPQGKWVADHGGGRHGLPDRKSRQEGAA